MRVQTVGGALIRGGQILLGLRAAHKSFAGCWDLIGGHVEPGETPRTALYRELTEEIGIVANDAQHVETIDAVAGATLQVFRISSWSGEPTIANDEHIAIGWFDLEVAEALPNLAVENYRKIFSMLR